MSSYGAPRSLVALSIVLLMSGLTVNGANASGSGLRVTPSRPTIGGKATIYASRLKPHAYYTLLLAVPDLARPKDRAFLPQLLKTDGRGDAVLPVRLPIITHCGKATIYAYLPGSRSIVQRSFDLTGCRAGTTVKSPPPPPAPTKKHKP